MVVEWGFCVSAEAYMHREMCCFTLSIVNPYFIRLVIALCYGICWTHLPTWWNIICILTIIYDWAHIYKHKNYYWWIIPREHMWTRFSFSRMTFVHNLCFFRFGCEVSFTLGNLNFFFWKKKHGKNCSYIIFYCVHWTIPYLFYAWFCQAQFNDFTWFLVA